ncbi:flagellar export chaperone FliS [uncultured Kiloniella sp.]|uniref:flagellar export chaperone FliS n=1 Tax=uncultured Kiloniella sp. TaxID=1133091 RepID=UPI002638DE26|nr:flagellar export chaperone FliS [uncultured Kiloniella sp.]
MYPNPYGANAYSQASKNVGPLKAIVMLYEGAIRLINEAKRAHDSQDYEARFIAIDKASKIILGLQGQLDFENGGDVSPMLHEFYDSLFMRMMQANSRNPEPIFEDVLISLKNMKETWATVAEQVGEGNQAAKGVGGSLNDVSTSNDKNIPPSSASLNV